MNKEATSQKPLVLFVDDQPDIREIVSIGARVYEAPFETAFADSRESALLVIRQRRPAAVILDVNLSGETGMSIAEDLHDEFPQVCKAVLTAYDLSTTRAAAEEYDMEVWSKPITPDVLVAKVVELLASCPAGSSGRLTTGAASSFLRAFAATVGLLGGVHVHKV